LGYLRFFSSIKKTEGKQMTWSKESREKQSNRFINPFKVIDYRGEVIAVYKNSVEEFLAFVGEE
jgi:lipocalin